MSGNAASNSEHAKANPTARTSRSDVNHVDRSDRLDRRVRRTRDLLGDALIALIQEKNFESISVQEILDRADVSRTAFYTHFTGKQDLFLSDTEDFLDAVSTLLTRRKAAPQRLAPIQEFFAHVAEVRPLSEALQASGKFADFRELGMGYFARSISTRLLLAKVNLTGVELRATSHALAGTLFSLLDWWLAHGCSPSAVEMDTLFHRIAWRGLQAPP